jgi:hypothetical protein
MKEVEVKRCPTCNRTFTDRNLTFCVDDGTPLITVAVPDEETVVSPHASGAGDSASSNRPPVYQPPGTYVPSGIQPGQKRRVWPWIVGLLGLFFIIMAGLIIAAVIVIPRMHRQPVATNTSNRNANVYRSDSNQNNSSNANESSDLGATNPPTDETTVLADLTELEHEWTVANINADTTRLDRILADDYAGTTLDGKTQGKAEYLQTIERDTSIQKWEFEDLEVDLIGDRATLNGLVRFQIEDKPREFRFVDKFVWRDGRWQATASIITPVD